MSIVGFHRILIGTGILFCVLFALLEGAAWLEGGGTGALLLAVGFGAAAGALAYYLAHLRRFLGEETPSR